MSGRLPDKEMLKGQAVLFNMIRLILVPWSNGEQKNVHTICRGNLICSHSVSISLRYSRYIKFSKFKGIRVLNNYFCGLRVKSFSYGDG